MDFFGDLNAYSIDFPAKRPPLTTPSKNALASMIRTNCAVSLGQHGDTRGIHPDCISTAEITPTQTAPLKYRMIIVFTERPNANWGQYARYMPSITEEIGFCT